jgi:hypothetical protein
MSLNQSVKRDFEVLGIYNSKINKSLSQKLSTYEKNVTR